jgi:hypothetical protein
MVTSSRRSDARARWRKRAERARDAFGLVLLLVLLTYVLASIVENRNWGAVILVLVTCTTSIVALTSAHAKPAAVRRAIVVAGVATLIALISAVFGGKHWLTGAAALEIGLLVTAMGSVLRRVVTSDTVTSRTILGALSVYAVLGIVFTWVYGAIDRFEDGTFFGPGVTATGTDFVFFSYTTLTTTGYGNLVPGGQPGRMISGLEMMLGQIFLVTLVAGLVSLWRPGEAIRRRRERRDGDPAATETSPPS